MEIQLTEEQLIAQYSDLGIPRPKAHAAAYSFLVLPENAEHWWCQHYDLTKQLGEVLLHQDHATPRQIWQAMTQQLGDCSSCISHYHAWQGELLGGEYELATARPLLATLLQLDKQRLLTWLTQQQQGQNSELALALFETLGFGYYLDDHQLCSVLIEQLNALNWQLDTDGQDSRFAGFYKLLAHPDGAVRAKASEYVNRVGPFSLQDFVESNIVAVLIPWLDCLQQQLTGSSNSNDDAVMLSHLIPEADKQQWAPVNIWFGLKVLFGLLEPDCVSSILSNHSGLLTLVLKQACPAAPWAQQQQQHPALAAAAGSQPAGPAAEGSMEHKHALGCLHLLLKSCKHELWQLVPELSPSELIQQLQAICWRRTADVGLLKLLVQVLQVVVASLLPYMAPAEVEFDNAEFEQASAQDDNQVPAATGSKLAIGTCLRLLLVQVPGSSVMPLLIRALALQAGIDCCTAALQSPSCPGTATFSHLWGPVCADVLYLPAEQQQSPWGNTAGGYKQHQAPGLVRLMPLLDQMDELRKKVMGAAADLVALALQADAAVLQAALDSASNSRATNRSSLVPGALDIIEVALNNAADFMCGPSLWLALAGCGHSTVSATYTAVAAQLAPLTGVASRKLGSAMMGASVQQHLDASLVLPNAETVALDSTQHMLYVLDYAGWLHGQLMRATIRHMHTCSVRSRFFILPRSQRPTSSLRSARGSQPTINALYQQLADSQALPPDNTAVEPYGVVVKSCCSLLMLGSDGPAAAVTAGAELALLSSCGSGVGELGAVIQKQLLAPVGTSAAVVVEAMLEAVQDVRGHKIQQVVVKHPQRLIAILQFTQYSLSAANQSGFDIMLPLLASYVNEAWQLMVDCLSSGAKLLTSCKQCNAADSRPECSQPAAGSDHHTGSAVISVLKAVMECLPQMWRYYQMLLEQRFEQRRLYMLSLDSQQADGDDMVLSQDGSQGWHGASQGTGSRPTSAVGDRATRMLHLEIQREMKCMVQLLQLGQQVSNCSSTSSSGSANCSQCCSAAANSVNFLQAWKTAVEGAVKATTAPMSKAVKITASELMSAETGSLDKLWLAKLFPSAAPGNLGSSGVGSWPTRLLSASGVAASSSKSAAAAAAAAAAATAAANVSAGTSAAADDDVIVIESDDELVGEWLSDEGPSSEHSFDKDGQLSSEEPDIKPLVDSEQVVLLDTSEEDEQQQQQQQLSPRQQLHSWPWLKQQGHLQQQQQQDGVKTGVTKLLQSSKTLNAANKQQHQQSMDTASLVDSLSESRAARRRTMQPDDHQFKALLASLDLATSKPQQQQTSKSGLQQQARASVTESSEVGHGAAAAPHAVGHLLSVTRVEGSKKQQQLSLTSGLQTAQPSRQQAARNSSRQQLPSPQSRQQQQVKPKDDSMNLESLWPGNWPSDHGDSNSFHSTGEAAGSSSRGWGVSKHNHTSGSRPRQKQQGQNLAGLSKADQLRAELLGRVPVGTDKAAAAPSRRAERAEQERLMAFFNEQIAKHTGDQQQQAPAAAHSEVQPKPQRGKQQQGKEPIIQEAEEQQQRERQRRLFLEQREREAKERERLERERKQKQQQDQLLKQQELEARRAEQQRQEAAKRAAAAAASASAGVNLINDGALFAQASSRLAASLQQKRHNVVTLKSGALVHGNRRYDALLRPTGAQAPGARLLGGPRGPEAVVLGNRYYPPLRLDEVVAELLSWGYLGAVGAENNASSSAALRNKLLDASGKVPLKFGSRGHYCHVFKGLLLEELRAGLAASYEELVTTGGSRREAAGSGSFKCLPLIIDSVQRQSHVHVINARVDTSGLQPWERDSPRTEDFILITKIKLTSAGQLAADKLPRSHLTGFVIDASVEQPGVRLVTFKVCAASAGSEVMANYWQQLLVVRAQLFCSVVTSLVPNFREFQALAALQQSPAGHRLFSQVLSPQPPSTPPPSALENTSPAAANNRSVTTISPALSAALVSAYNQSQQSAVAACLDKRWPFVLVQGPPGTGKTSAIIGILSALLAAKSSDAGGDTAAAKAKGQKAPGRRSKKGAKGVLDPAAAQDALQLGVIPPVRILVCAQSNAAIDELATRLANEGVWGEQGEKRPPAMVRLGRSDATHPSVLMFHVDALADNQVAQQQQQQQLLPQQKTDRDALQQRMQNIKGQLQQVEEQLAALSNKQKAGNSADAATFARSSKADDSGQLEDNPQHQAAHKRGRAAAGTSTAVSRDAKHQSESHAAKKQKISSLDPAVVRSYDQESNSDMDMSDGEGPEADRYNRQQHRPEDSRRTSGSKDKSRSSSRERDREQGADRDRGRDRGHNRDGDRHRSSRRDSSTERHRKSRSVSRERRMSVRDSEYSRKSKDRSSSRDRYPRESRRNSHRRSRSRDRSSSRGRHRGRHRSSSRGRRSKSPSRHQRHSREGEGGQQRAGAAGSAADDQQQEQQQPYNATVNESLLRDQQRSLLASLRTVELELQRRSVAGGGRELERAKRSARQAVISAAEIVMCTLSAAGGDLLHCFPAGVEAPLFDVLVVDEAAQALEPATLIPMQMLKPGTGRVVLVGDPCQLPPTVLSRAAEAALLAQSMFERLARAGWPVTLLREQYRMHPLISAFPSRFFYDDQLVDGGGITAVSKGAKFHSRLAYSPFVMWDCWEGREARGGAGGGGGSLRNNAEAQLAAALVAGVLQSYRGDVGSIAVISPYKAQVSALRYEFRRALGGDAALTAANIEFGTVDGFQGREADIVVFSCVRAQPEACTTPAGSLTPGPGHEAASTSAAAAATVAGGGPRVGFLADVRRMNVGLTRGRRAVWVVCHAGTLAASSAWRPLLQEARSRGVLLEARAPFNRLLVATDKQLRGSYWTPAAAAAAVAQVASPEQRPPPPGAIAAAGGVKPRELSGTEPSSATVVTDGDPKQRQPVECAKPDKNTTAPGARKDVREQQQSAQLPPQPAVPRTSKTAARGAAKKVRPPVSTQQGISTASGASKQEAAAADKLRAALQQRLEKQQQVKKNRQDTAHPHQKGGDAVGRHAANRPTLPKQHTAGAAAGADTAGGRSAVNRQQGGRGAAAAEEGKADWGKLAKGAAAAAAAAAAARRTGTGVGSAGVPHTGQQRTQQPVTGRGGGSQADKPAQSQQTASSGDDKLRAALLRRIQQQQQQRK